MTNDKGPFQVVLIDLQRAANKEIYCVKKPLSDPLKYVAISYRWGELQETNVDTGVGYVASITSFDIQDFYALCTSITKEPDLQSIPYVWVDAICVNQSDHDERKATIYHMTKIYEQATWILAVPDLHSAHLKAMTNHKQTMELSRKHQAYLYHLVYGNIDLLYELDHAFLNELGVPPDPALRQLLMMYTNCFAESFMNFRQDNVVRYNESEALAHLYDIHTRPTVTDNDGSYIVNYDIKKLHQCELNVGCPFNNVKRTQHKEWHREILQRRTEIRQAMHFLTDLVVDWSSRVWVISEFHISKKKNNLKFWFNQLSLYDAFSFFTFDMNNPNFKTFQNINVPSYVPIEKRDAVYITFYQQLINQLNRQTFLEMMLKSKASKNEDRFYSIFPLFPEYQPLLLQTNQDLLNNISSMLSVKLKLYQVMTNEHKMWFLFLANRGKTTWTLPTFATPVIDWKDPTYYSVFTQTVDPTNASLMLCYERRIEGGLHYLSLKPTTCSILWKTSCADVAAARTLAQIYKRKGLDHTDPEIDILLIHDLRICLIGSYQKNTWILSGSKDMIKISLSTSMKDLPRNSPALHVY